MRYVLLPLLALPLLAAPNASASTDAAALAKKAIAAAELTADQILDEALKSGAIGFSKGTAMLSMDIVDGKGRKKNRTLSVKAMTDKEGQLKTLLKFDRPAEVAGMGFLVLQKNESLPDQFIYMPAARVTRRVPAGNAGGSLFGSDFSYVDLMPLPASERDQVKLVRLPDAKVAKRATYVISAEPQVAGSPYSKLVTYVDQQHLIPLRIEFFGPDGNPLKTLKIKALKKVQQRLIPTKLAMVNERTGGQTVLKVSNIQADAPLSASDFTEEALQR